MLKTKKRENARANYSHKRLFCTGRRERGIFDREKRKKNKRNRERRRKKEKKGIHRHTQNRRTFAPDQLYTHDNINITSRMCFPLFSLVFPLWNYCIVLCVTYICVYIVNFLIQCQSEERDRKKERRGISVLTTTTRKWEREREGGEAGGEILEFSFLFF